MHSAPSVISNGPDRSTAAPSWSIRPANEVARVSVVGTLNHHLDINVWQSSGAGPRDDAARGIAWFSLEIAATAKLSRVRRSAWPAGGGRAGLVGSLMASRIRSWAQGSSRRIKVCHRSNTSTAPLCPWDLSLVHRITYAGAPACRKRKLALTSDNLRCRDLQRNHGNPWPHRSAGRHRNSARH